MVQTVNYRRRGSGDLAHAPTTGASKGRRGSRDTVRRNQRRRQSKRRLRYFRRLTPPPSPMVATCSCGQQIAFEERHVGRSARCRCGRAVRLEAKPANERLADQQSRPASDNRSPWAKRIVPYVVATAVVVMLGVYVWNDPDYSYVPPSVPIAPQTTSRPPIATGTVPLSPLGGPLRSVVIAPTRQRVPDCNPDATAPRRGTELMDGERGSAGRLIIEHSGSEDAVVTMIDAVTSRAVRRIYAPASQRGLILDVPAGLYVVRFGFGAGYSSAKRRFCDDRGAQEYEDSFDYPSDRERTWTITLLPEIGGNAKTHRIPSELVFRDSL